MIKSMTGYGKGSNEYFKVEIRSLNHKACEIRIRLPQGFMLLEDKIRSYTKERLSRGRVDIFIEEEKPLDGYTTLKIDENLMREFLNQLDNISKSIKLENDLKLSHLLNMPDIITLKRDSIDEEMAWTYIREPLGEALENLNEMKLKEGERIFQDIRKRIDGMKGALQRIKSKAADLPRHTKEKLEKRLHEMLGEREIDENRLMLEIAILADRYDITEEIVRIGSHISQFESMLGHDESIGRELNFLSQELNREVNTISSKTDNLEIIQDILFMKNELEKIREQIQNIE
ncbi:MAG: YicC/YloC family endoribonuclease [bacterium]|nr:YicC/YloC family endoribonuclease [bacterium]